MQFRWIVIMIAALLGTWPATAKAAYSFTSTEIDATPVIFTMKDTTSVTFQITNTSTGTNVDERIYMVRFRLTGTTGGTVFLNTTTAPAGWTITSFSTTSITFRANTANNAIVCTTAGCPTGAATAVNFTLKITAGSYSADLNQSLRDVRAYFQNATSPWPPSGYDQRITLNSGSSIGLWTLKSLLMTLVPSVTAIPVGGTFTLTMTVTNNSTSNLTGINSLRGSGTINNPPQPSAAIVNTPASVPTLNLNAGATGTMSWTFTGTAAGTVTFTAYAGSGTRTSKTVTSIPVSIGLISGSIAVTPVCRFTGQTATFTMTVTNTTGGTVNNVAPSVLTPGGTATIGTFTPVPPTPTPVNLANGASTQFIWTAPVSGAVLDTYFVTGSATGNGGNTTGIITSNTEDIDGYLVSLDTTDVNVSSGNQELTWTVVNQACAPIQSVSISFPSDWTWGGGAADSYALVTNTIGNPVESWGVSSPLLGSVQFASPNPTDQIPLTQGGSFELDFSATPTTTGSGLSGPFTVTVTDANGLVTVLPSMTVNLHSFNYSLLNQAGNESHREDFR